MTYPYQQPAQPGPQQPPRKPVSATGFWVGGGLLVGAAVLFVLTFVVIAVMGDGSSDTVDELRRDNTTSTTPFSTDVTSRVTVDAADDLVVLASSPSSLIRCSAVSGGTLESEYDRNVVRAGGRVWWERYEVDDTTGSQVEIECEHPRYVTLAVASDGTDYRGLVAVLGLGLSFLLGVAGVVLLIVTGVRRASR
ncbi:MAG: hypothetical protein PGN07_08220 [Aeromicrobium erythreum]